MICSKCGNHKPLTDFPSRGRMCKSCVHDYNRQYRDTPEWRARMVGYNLLRTHGITLDEFKRMLKRQRRRCAICGAKAKGKDFGVTNSRLHVDHDHDTGAVRGLLCKDCNVGLGMFGDDPDRLRAAIRYLAEHGRW